MSNVTNAVTVSDVTCIPRPGIGPVYRAVLPIKDLYYLLKDSVLRYAPKYQRGFKEKLLPNIGESEYERLLPLNDPQLQISEDRAAEMAVKYLKAATGDPNIYFFSANVVWNARREVGRPEPHYDVERKTLAISTALTIPDTAHRHTANYLLMHWKLHPNEIPAHVTVNEDFVVDQADIQKMLAQVDFDDGARHAVYVDIYCLNAEKEGWLYDEFNSDSKPPSRAVGLDLNKRKTPSRRFTWALVDKCRVFSRDEVEARSSTIAAQSRKITTTSTLESAIKPFVKDLLILEKNQNVYDNLVDFFCAYYDEWARLFPAFGPNAKLADRQSLRKNTFAASNVVFFPMFRIGVELWKNYKDKKIDWKTDPDWKNSLAKMAGKVTSGNWSGKVMDRDNPDWRGKILIETFDANGKPKGWSLSSTRQTRDAAYAYLKSRI